MRKIIGISIVSIMFSAVLPGPVFVLAQSAPGVVADENHPAGAPDPEKLDQIWSVDPLTGSVSIKIPITTTPEGGRGPKLPFALSYNSNSTLTLQATGSYTLPAYGWPFGVQTATMRWSPTPVGSVAPTGPTGPWTTTGPFFNGVYTSQFPNANNVQFCINGNCSSISFGYGCSITGPYQYTDENGASHDMNLEAYQSNYSYNNELPPCQDAYNASQKYGATSYTTDGSAMQTSSSQVVYPDGTKATSGTLTDTNLNTATLTLAGGVYTATDALGRTVYKTNIPIGGSGQIPARTYYVDTYGPTGNTEEWTIVFSTYAIGSFSLPHPNVSSEISNPEYCIGMYSCPANFSVSQPNGSTFSAISSITRPGGSRYTFLYDPTYGTVSKITFPTGGYVQFQYAVVPVAAEYGQFTAVSDIAVSSVQTSDGSNWTYNVGFSGTTATDNVTAPDGSYTSYKGDCSYFFSMVPTYQFGSRPTCKETERYQYSSAGGNLLRSVFTSYKNAPGQLSTLGDQANGLTTSIATTVYDGPNPQQQQVAFSYDTYANATVKDESDFYTCAGLPCPAAAVPTTPPGGWKRITYTQYAYNSNASMSAAHIVNKPSQILVTDGSGNPASLVQYTYDPNGKGNLTDEYRCISISGTGPSASCSSSWHTQNTYDAYGQLHQKTDGSGSSSQSTTTYNWTGQGSGYLTSIQTSDGCTDSYTYYETTTGQVSTRKDCNNQTTTFTYSDPLHRIKTITAPQTLDGTTGFSGNGTTTFNYTDTANSVAVEETHNVDTSGTTTSVTKKYDGLGRVISVVTKVPPNVCSSGTTLAFTWYDSMGRVSTVTNPYCSSSDPTYGSTSYQYDGLGRRIQTTLPDGATSYVTYGGRATETTDPWNGSTNIQHIQQVDGLGHLTDVCEVTGTPLGPDAAPSACNLDVSGTGYHTTYTYDVLGNLTGVNQHGQLRSFNYDGLSRLRCASNPESATASCPAAPTSSWVAGTVGYTYSTSGTACAPDSSLPCTRTDARGVITTYRYDSVNRLTAKSYSLAPGNSVGSISDLSSCYQYNAALSSVSDANPKGQLTAEWEQSATCPTSSITSMPSNAIGVRIFSNHDAMGRVGRDQQCLTGASCSSSVGVFTYTYNLLGNPVQSNNGIFASAVSATQVPSSTGNGTPITAPSLTWQTKYDLADHITTVTVQDQPAWSGTVVFQSSTYSAGPTLLSAGNYDPLGHVTAAKLDVPTGSTTPAATISRQYDPRSRIYYELDYGTGTAGAATNSIGTISISGNEQGPVYPANSYAHSTVTLSGTERSVTVNPCHSPAPPCPYTQPDIGTVTITISGHAISTGYGASSTPQSLASTLTGQINGAGIGVTASYSSATITVRSNTQGTAGNGIITIAAISYTTQTAQFSGTSFPVSLSGSPLSGGYNTTANVYDSGSVSATINGKTALVLFNSSSTAQSIASDLSTQLQSVAGSFLTAKTDGDVDVIISSSTGGSTNFPITMSVTYDNADFAKSSFNAIASPSMSNGNNGSSGSGLVYYYFVPSGGYAPNGNILVHSDMVMGDWYFAYDNADRLAVAVPDTTAPSKYLTQFTCWTWQYDTYGNRWQEGYMAAPCTGSITPASWATYNTAKNRMQTSNYAPGGITLDASGDTLLDGRNQYWYNAEGQLCAVQSAGAIYQYVYDPGGARIGQATLSSGPGSATSLCAAPFGTGFALSKRYLVDLSGDQATELSSSGVWQHSNIWLGGKLTATYDTKGIHMELSDPLGTKRVQVNSAGLTDETCTSLPFGNDVNNPFGPSCSQPSNPPSTADDATEHHFTGKERDAESGNDYFDARFYASTMGRFMSPDWSAKEDPVPYASLDDPQSLNLYSYVRNNPLTRTDPDGHCCSELTLSTGGFELPPLPNPFHPLVPYPDQYTLTPEKLQQAFNEGGAAIWSFESSAYNTVKGWFSKSGSAPASSASVDGQSTPASPQEPNRKDGGSRTEPNLPKKTVANEDGVEIKHFTRSGDHGPAHLHVEGGGESTKIGMNGKPIEGSPELSSTQQSVVNNNLGTIRRAVDAIQRWFNYNSR